MSPDTKLTVRVIVASLFGLSLLLAPWSRCVAQSERHAHLGLYRYQTEWRPVFDPPESFVRPAQLRLEILAVEWVALGGALAFTFRRRP